MVNTSWYSLKHNAWAIVTDEPVTRSGYYTIEFPSLGMYRRYNAERIAREVAEFQSIDAQLAAQGIPAGPIPPNPAAFEYGAQASHAFAGIRGIPIVGTVRQSDTVSLREAATKAMPDARLVAVVLVFDRGDSEK